MPDKMVDTYKTVKSKSESQFKDKGSRFLSFVFPIENEGEVKSIISDIRKMHHGARHCCYAWRIGTEKIRYRTNDDGEPSSTAGKPILGQLLSLNLTNAMVVVVRYFGGTLLGVPGLINAYKSAASNALANAEIIEKFMELELRIIFTYSEMNNVMQIIKNEKLNQVKTDFDETCQVQVKVRKSESERVENLFKSLNGVTVKPII
jgi:uncharacterized YigZ family protein